MSKPDSPCKDCAKRQHLCHATCAEYVAFQRDSAAYNKKVLENKRKHYDAESVSVARSDRANKVVKRRK